MATQYIPYSSRSGSGGGGGGSGTVTSVSVTAGNGFAGTVANPTTTPAITLTTTVTGIVYGNGTSLAAAIASNFPTLNQNTTGTAANITATTNSTLTTLSSLSLPYSQVTGGPSAFTLGNLDSQAANAQGLSYVSNVLSAQSATTTEPGLVNTGSQSFSGIKTFSSSSSDFITIDPTFTSGYGLVVKGALSGLSSIMGVWNTSSTGTSDVSFGNDTGEDVASLSLMGSGTVVPNVLVLSNTADGVNISAATSVKLKTSGASQTPLTVNNTGSVTVYGTSTSIANSLVFDPGTPSAVNLTSSLNSAAGVSVTSTSAGASAAASLALNANNASYSVYVTSSGQSSSGIYLANQTQIIAGGAGGLVVDSGSAQVYAINNVAQITLPAGGGAVHGTRVSFNRVVGSDANLTIDHNTTIEALPTLTASRTYTLPLATSVAPGTILYVVDEAGSLSSGTTLTIAANGTDTLNGVGGGTSVMNSAYKVSQLFCNGTTGWVIH
jgi:hypothetical protein